VLIVEALVTYKCRLMLPVIEHTALLPSKTVEGLRERTKHVPQLWIWENHS